MPPTMVVFYKDGDESIPVKMWLEELQRKDRKAFAKCVERIQQLAALGHELRRPICDYLRDGVFELRVRHGNVNYRILYVFFGRNVAVLVHGLTKERAVPDRDIDLAIRRKNNLEQNPAAHIHEEADNGTAAQDE